MKTLNNLASAFHLLGSNKTLLVNLRLDQSIEEKIDAVERIIRISLSESLPAHLCIELPPNIDVPKPKFLRQGSRAYKTINDPIRDSKHYQEADSDIGVYVPMEFVKEVVATPKIGVKVLRKVVFECLEKVARVHGWDVKEKHTCIRVGIRPDAHIDITCYAIPEIQFREMLAECTAHNVRKFAADGLVEEDEITWDEIPETAHLATLTGWIRSDAKAIHQKIDNACALKGMIFKRVVRFIKAVRDFADDPDGPCSIAITLIVADRLDLALCRLDRDDLAVHSMLSVMQDALFKSLPTPGNEDVDILADMPYAIRERLAEKMRQCCMVMHEALYDLPVDRAHVALQKIFGERFPNAPAIAASSDTTVSIVSSAAQTITTQPSSVGAVAPRGNARSA